ncbi:SAC3/GANP/Nin1/mts3/eIF-3 p25 family-domain-containing protein [Cladochytrium replicatum]|nr:SAC3/GANP/Nin1/mts3/eIF-3 p25 family-domain-containing protein [Cladochytrium replicatum]
MRNNISQSNPQGSAQPSVQSYSAPPTSYRSASSAPTTTATLAESKSATENGTASTSASSAAGGVAIPPPWQLNAASKKWKPASITTPTSKPAYIPIRLPSSLPAKSTPAAQFSDPSAPSSTTQPELPARPQTPPPPYTPHADTTAAPKEEDRSRTTSAGSNGEGWPQSLKDYVQRVFAEAGDRRPAAEAQLKQLIIEVNAKGALWDTDWNVMPLPSACYPDSQDRNASVPQKRKKVKGIFGTSPPESPASQKSSPKREWGDSNALSSLPPAQRALENARLQKRAKRFESSSGSGSPAPVAPWRKNLESPATPDTSAIVGTSTKLEKRYLRLTSAPDPSTVRPLHILEQTLALLRQKWKDEGNYTYVCDQFKSLRQDLTVQRIRNEFTIRVYESHARIALEKKDLGEYNQCQGQLYELYKLGIPGGHVEEFLAYRILYMIHTKNKSELHGIILSLPAPPYSEPVQHALDVRKAVSTGDYHALFRLYHLAPNMGAYLMDHFAPRERARAMRAMGRAYKPRLSVVFLAVELGFIPDLFWKAAQRKARGAGAKEDDEDVDMEVEGGDEEEEGWEDAVRDGVEECRRWIEGCGCGVQQTVPDPGTLVGVKEGQLEGAEAQAYAETSWATAGLEKARGDLAAAAAAEEEGEAGNADPVKVEQTRKAAVAVKKAEGVLREKVRRWKGKVWVQDAGACWIVESKEAVGVFVDVVRRSEMVVDIKGQVH